MPKRILIAAPSIYHSPPADMIYEVVEKHLAQGDEVFFAHCRAVLPACELNPERNLKICARCMGRHAAYRKLLSSKVKLLPLADLTPDQKAILNKVPKQFESITALLAHRVENFDVGAAAFSSLVSHLRDPEPDLAENASTIRRMLLAGLAFYYSVRTWIQEHSIDLTYGWNGRHLLSRAVLRAAQFTDARVAFVEFGSNFRRYAIYPDDMHHGVTYRENAIRTTWEAGAADPAKRDELAHGFFANRLAGRPDYVKSYTSEQKKGALGRFWDPTKHNVAIFNSSEDEFVAIGDELRNPLYDSQLDGLKRIIQDLSGRQHNVHLYLRMHPNLSNLHYRQLEEVRNLEASFLTVFQPEDRISSYELLMNADKVLTFGSSVGIEAAYWGKPSILAGKCYYMNLGSTHNPATHEELMEMLLGDLAPLPQAGALIYGYYFATYGYDFQYYAPDNLEGGQFKGETPTAPVFYDFLEFIHTASFKHAALGSARKAFKRRTENALLGR